MTTGVAPPPRPPPAQRPAWSSRDLAEHGYLPVKPAGWTPVEWTQHLEQQVMENSAREAAQAHMLSPFLDHGHMAHAPLPPTPFLPGPLPPPPRPVVGSMRNGPGSQVSITAAPQPGLRCDRQENGPQQISNVKALQGYVGEVKEDKFEEFQATGRRP